MRKPKSESYARFGLASRVIRPGRGKTHKIISQIHDRELVVKRLFELVLEIKSSFELKAAHKRIASGVTNTNAQQ